MNPSELKALWTAEEAQAHIRGWDFSHIQGRFDEERDLPWQYRSVVGEYLRESHVLLDYDTGGGEFLRSLGHPPSRTAATEGYPPNVRLCEKTLLPLGIDFRPCADPGAMPFSSETFDIILNRHGSFHAGELFRLLKPGGIFLTEQVGEDNDRDLARRVLPEAEKPFPHLNLTEQRRILEAAGFQILRGEEAYRPIRFYDVGAFVWFARVIPWEFPGFSVERCFDRLLALQEDLQRDGVIEGTIHRYLLVTRK